MLVFDYFSQPSENLAIEDDPTKLLPQLLDQLITLGQMAQQLSHALRHTFATLMTECGLDEISCRRLMRHADSSMTERYVHLNLKPLKRKLEQFSPIRLLAQNRQKLDEMLV